MHPPQTWQNNAKNTIEEIARAIDRQGLISSTLRAEVSRSSAQQRLQHRTRRCKLCSKIAFKTVPTCSQKHAKNNQTWSENGPPNTPKSTPGGIQKRGRTPKTLFGRKWRSTQSQRSEAETPRNTKAPSANVAGQREQKHQAAPLCEEVSTISAQQRLQQRTRRRKICCKIAFKTVPECNQLRKRGRTT